MIQNLFAVIIVAICAAWLGIQAYRYFRPKPGSKACGAGCGCDAEKPVANAANAGTPGRQTLMISSDDLRARIKARKS